MKISTGPGPTEQNWHIQGMDQKKFRNVADFVSRGMLTDFVPFLTDFVPDYEKLFHAIHKIKR